MKKSTEDWTNEELLAKIQQLRVPGAHKTLVIESYNGKIVQVETKTRERKKTHIT